MAIKSEQNLRFHFVAALYIYLFSAFYDFSKLEYALITILVAGVLALEMMNSSIERAVDRPTPGKFYIVGAVKDMAAGAVFVFCIGAVVCGVLLFWDIPTFVYIFEYFTKHFFMLMALLISFAIAAMFIFRKED